MPERRTRILLFFAFALVALAGISSASANAAWNGEITRAEADEDWAFAHIAGAVEWTGCEHWVTRRAWEEPGDHPHCGWLPYVTLGPGSQTSDCETYDRDLAHLGEEVTLVWQGEERVRYEQDFLDLASFDGTSVPLSGPDDQLVCLSITETAPEQVLIFCPAQFGFPCPWFKTRKFHHEVASALLGAVELEEAEPEPGQGGEEEPESQPSAGEELSTSESPEIPGSAGGSPAVMPPSLTLPHTGKKHHRRCKGGKRQRAAHHRRCRHRLASGPHI